LSIEDFQLFSYIEPGKGRDVALLEIWPDTLGRRIPLPSQNRLEVEGLRAGMLTGTK
jgi:hypothetical protein